MATMQYTVHISHGHIHSSKLQLRTDNTRTEAKECIFKLEKAISAGHIPTTPTPHTYCSTHRSQNCPTHSCCRVGEASSLCGLGVKQCVGRLGGRQVAGQERKEEHVSNVQSTMWEES